MKTVTNLKDRTQYFASDELLKELESKLKGGDVIINFAYTDYGGDFYDKVMIQYFEEKHPESIVSESTAWSGQNAFVFGEIAKQFLEENENYPLRFEETESFYSTKEDEEETKGFEFFLDDVKDKYEISENALELLREKRGGHYSITTQGLDYSTSDLIEFCLENGILTEKTETE